MDYLIGPARVAFFLLISIWGLNSSPDMQDSEPDTCGGNAKPELCCEIWSKIGVDAHSKEIGTDEVELGEYYSRCFSQTPRMVTNKGCLDVKNSNIDVIQIIQKGWKNARTKSTTMGGTGPLSGSFYC